VAVAGAECFEPSGKGGLKVLFEDFQLSAAGAIVAAPAEDGFREFFDGFGDAVGGAEDFLDFSFFCLEFCFAHAAGSVLEEKAEEFETLLFASELAGVGVEGESEFVLEVEFGLFEGGCGAIGRLGHEEEVVGVTQPSDAGASEEAVEIEQADVGQERGKGAALRDATTGVDPFIATDGAHVEVGFE
jgi:hypothetical protein